jgi:bacteriorhodopsin
MSDHQVLPKILSATNKELIDNSFYITYVFLMTTATITFIEAMRTNDIKVRNILNLETCISVVAAFFYSKFVEKMEKEPEIDYEKINKMRYTDWAITTPIMLLVLVLAFLYNTKQGSLAISQYVIILLLNYGMLGLGYMGEIGVMSKLVANGFGFAFFAGLFGYLYNNFVAKQYNFDNMLLFMVFFILWALYGVVYFFDEVNKNVSFNILDLFSKCFVGIFFWAYFTKIFKLK